jgi:hypothetical protein
LLRHENRAQYLYRSIHSLDVWLTFHLNLKNHLNLN